MSSHTFKWQVGPKVLIDGDLLFYTDMGNTHNSYLGKPITNQITEPNDFNAAGWTRVGVSVAQIFDVPEDEVLETTATSAHYILFDSSITSGTTYTMSFYAKPDERRFVQLAPSTGFPATDYANFDLVNGTITGSASGISKATMTYIKKGYNQGWYRCTYTETANATTSGRMVISLLTAADNTRVPSYAGTLNAGLFVRDVQMEANSYASDFIDGTRGTSGSLIDLTGNVTLTAGSSVVHNSDKTFQFNYTNGAAGCFAGNLTGSINHDQYTRIVWIETSTRTTSSQDQYIFQNSIGNNANMAVQLSAGGKPSFHQYTGSNAGADADYTFAPGSAVSTNSYYMIAVTVDTTTSTNNISVYTNGSLDGTTSKNLGGSNLSNSDQLRLGGPSTDSYSGARYFDGKIHIAMHYDRVLTAEEIKANYIATRGRFGLT